MDETPPPLGSALYEARWRFARLLREAHEARRAAMAAGFEELAVAISEAIRLVESKAGALVQDRVN